MQQKKISPYAIVNLTHKIMSSTMVDLETFFKEHGVDDHSVISRSSLSDVEANRVSGLLPSFRSIIVMGKEMPAALFDVESKTMSHNLLQIEKHMDEVAFKLCDLLRRYGNRAVAIPTFLPLEIKEGRIKGLLSLKHAAARGGMGELGENTLLITERFGNRLCLSGILVDKEYPSSKHVSTASCMHCKRCVAACPAGAISSEGVDSLRCINVTNLMPSAARPFFKAVVRSGIGSGHVASFVNGMSFGEMTCSKCVTVCPFFDKIRG